MAKQKATKQKTKASVRISNVTRPSKMSLKEWQIKLRDFICTADAQEMIDRFFDDKAREERLNEIFCDRFWWKEYLVKGIIPYPYQVEGMVLWAQS